MATVSESSVKQWSVSDLATVSEFNLIVSQMKYIKKTSILNVSVLEFSIEFI